MVRAHKLGASPAFAAYSVWMLFFTCGGVVKVLYCLSVTVNNGITRALAEASFAVVPAH